MGSGILGIGGSDSVANDNRLQGGDAAIVTRGSKNKTAYANSTQVDFSGAKLDSSTKITGNKGPVAITYNDTAPIANLAAQFADTVKTVSGSASSALAAALEKQSHTVEDALGKVSDLSANAQTGGDTSRNKIVLYVVLAALTLLGVVFYFRKL